MDGEKLHFVFLPFMAQGHVIPLVDIAKLLAERSGITVTLLLTPLNHIRVKPMLEQGAHIHVEELNFPAKEVGLPADCEYLDALPSLTMAPKFLTAVFLLQPQVETLLQKMMRPKPCCLVADMCFLFAAEVARKSGIPRIFFNGMNCFASLCIHHLLTLNYILEYLDVPGTPHKITFTESHLKCMGDPENQESREFNDKMMENENAAHGVIFNTFEDLEPVYMRGYEEVTQKKIWSMGPVSMFHKQLADKAIRGQTSEIEVDQCLKWLDSWEPAGSVIYACLGSNSTLTSAQMLELGLGLEASGKPFIWVIRSGVGNNKSTELLRQLMEQNGFEERVKNSNRGHVLSGWATQVLILSHRAIGGFLTHCGANSLLEGISPGIPMITWPLFGDQFYNETLLVDILKIGVRVGVKGMMELRKEEEMGVQVHKDEVRKAVEELMDEGDEEGEARRKRVKELAYKAKIAVEEGGSSHDNIEKFIEDVRQFATKNTYVWQAILNKWLQISPNHRLHFLYFQIIVTFYLFFIT